MQYIYIAVSILAGADFLVAFYIFNHKQTGKSLSCPLHGNCEAVVHSKYGRTFGIGNSFLGMLYNAGMISGILANYIFNIKILGFYLEFWLMLMAIVGAIFSLYLMGVMVFKIKEKCTWCISSAVIAVLIAALLITNSLLIK